MSTKRQHTVGNGCARVKVIAAAAAAGAVVTMGALTVALSSTEAPKATADAIGSAGSTSTQAPPPSTLAVTKAAPALKAHKWQGNGWPGQ